jgi:glucose-6-phosphate dehydrogenase assembly protein OpcA
MSVRLDDTTAARVSTAIDQERFRQGSSAVGRVLTLVIVADEASQADALRAAAEAAREHPSRILVTIPRPGRGPARLDAEVSVGGADGLGEVAELRLRGPLAHHAASVVLPLLVPDAPVVVWWPTHAPDVPSEDPVGRLAQRRITDAGEGTRPLKELDTRRHGYHAGDTDLAWTRITPWRALLASALDQPTDRITGASVSFQRHNPSGVLLAAWLQRGLGVPVETHTSRGPGITSVAIHTEHGDILVNRPDGRVARMTRPGYPEREAPLKRRSIESLIAEELRRLDPDEVYGETLTELPRVPGFVAAPAVRRAGTFRQPDDSHDGTDDSAGAEERGADAAARRTARTTASAAPKKAPATKAPPKPAPPTKKVAATKASPKPAARKAAR